MRSTKHFITMLFCLLLCAPLALARQPQDKQSETQSANPISQDVMIIIQQEKVRFTAQKAVQEMRLQILDQSGAVVYDSGSVAEPALNWPLQDASGVQVKSGLYAYTLTIQEDGAGATSVRRGHFIVDRAKDRDGQNDRLWITSQNDAGIGSNLTVARSENDTVAGVSIASEQTPAPESAAKQTTPGLAAGTGATSDTNALTPAMPAGASNGTVGYLAKFITATDLGNSSVTEQNGNVGIGTANPLTRLSVQTATANYGFTHTDGNVVVGTWVGAGSAGTPSGWFGTLSNHPLRFFTANGGASMTIATTGNVGVGTTNPAQMLHVSGQNPRLRLEATVNNTWAVTEYSTLSIGDSACSPRPYCQQEWHTGVGGPAVTNDVKGKYYIADMTAGQFRMVVDRTGNVGIGTTSPNHQLSLGRGPSWTTNGWGGAMELQNGSAIGWQTNAAGNRFGIGHTDGGLYFFHTAADPATIVAPVEYDLSISDTGVVSVKTLQITGGSDFSENFDIHAPTTTSETLTKIEAGMVVSIDPGNPGKLALSSQAYDRRVAGVISGAGGVKPGMMMSQPGTLADGRHPVALSGRVYCWVDATQGAIEPGDLLTTSNTPGHAMKATDTAKAQGAIVGKAMTGLKEGKGLALVLVTLQ